MNAFTDPTTFDPACAAAALLVLVITVIASSAFPPAEQLAGEGDAELTPLGVGADNHFPFHTGDNA